MQALGTCIQEGSPGEHRRGCISPPTPDISLAELGWNGGGARITKHWGHLGVYNYPRLNPVKYFSFLTSTFILKIFLYAILELQTLQFLLGASLFSVSFYRNGS